MAKYQSDEWRQNISKALKGRKPFKYWKGKKFTVEHKQKISNSVIGKHLGEESGKWRGDLVGKRALHRWVAKRLIKPTFCVLCNENPPKDLANKTGIYNRDLINWYWLCRKCHMGTDGRFKNLKQFKKL